MGRLANKNILITGGNSGIGLAAAQEFDREGARVAICGLNEGSLRAAKEGRMLPMRIPRLLAFAGTLTACLWASAPAASAGSPSGVEDKAIFTPIESIRYDFGSKSMSEYFVEQAGGCGVMLMVSETTDPDKPPPPSAARVRLVLLPGQIAGLDSDEGRSLNFTCGEGGTTLLVNAGERDRLVNLQAHGGTSHPIARGRA